jgi:hypothetical protein
MTYTFKLARRIARFRAPLLAPTLLVALAGCGSDQPFNPETSESTPMASASFAGGIPIGISAMPVTEYGARYNGALLLFPPKTLLNNLAEIKARGGKVILKFMGHPRNYGEGTGFNLGEWKDQIDQYKGIDFSAYVKDGTVVGHYMIDEPNDPANWGGKPIPPSTLEEMGKYSKSLWPDLPTIVRVEPSYLSFGHKYIDAAWAAYLYRRGPVDEYLRRNVSDAQARGLGLIVGLNFIDGGVQKLTPMTPAQVQSWGAAMLNSTYPCAFMSWRWEERALDGAMGSAMDALRKLAQNRSARSCRGTAAGGSPTPPPPPPPAPPEPPAQPPAPSAGVPFGPWGLPTSEMASYSGAVRNASPDNVIEALRAARQAGSRVMLRLTGSDLANRDGTFSLTKWKQAVDRYARMDLSSYISDGTFAGHMLAQNPQNAGAWGGEAISHATLDEMARYSRQLWPSVPTLAHAPATWLAGNGAGWKYLDAASVTYSGSSGDPAAWVGNQAGAAGRARLGLLVGMNVLNGGTSPSKLAGTTRGRLAMSASQLESWGSALVAHSRVCGLVLSRYDEGYFGRSDVKTAVAALRDEARARAATSCRTR